MPKLSRTTDQNDRGRRWPGFKKLSLDCDNTMVSINHIQGRQQAGKNNI
jgi:hypothetical protein